MRQLASTDYALRLLMRLATTGAEGDPARLKTSEDLAREIGVPRNHFYDGITPDVRRAMEHSISVLRSLGMRIVEIDAARNLLLISGAVPGSEGGEVIVRPSVKAARLAKRKSIAPTKKADKKDAKK